MAQIYGKEYAVAVGTTIKTDGWRLNTRVIAGDEFSELRLETNNAHITSLAARFEVTGRTFKRMEGDLWVRVRITFIGDGEPDTFQGGYMRAGW